MTLRPVAPLLYLSAFVLFPVAWQGASAQGVRRAVPLKISLAAEEPTGVFFDRDTIAPQTPLLFTARIENPSPVARQVDLEWKITDSQGRVRLKRNSKFTVEGADSIVRRELFDAPGRGGYLLQTTVQSKAKGPDTTETAALPFAVTVAPLPGSNAARPQSFFVLSTPALLSPGQLDFYARLGARVLRSPLPPDPAKPDWPAVEAQLGERLKRNLATIALLPMGTESVRRSEAFWARQVPATLARYGSLTTWELSGDPSAADLDAWAQLARARRSDVSLLGPLPSDLPTNFPTNASVRINALEGATFDWPEVSAHPAALRRLWLSRAAATRSAGLPAFHLRRDEDENSDAPGDAAAEMTQDYLSAIMAGASSMSETLAPPALTPAAQNSTAGAMARGAAFSMLSRTLEDAAFREELFPNSPAFEGALFRAPRGSIAILYATRDIGTMLARVTPARCYDVFGNPISADEKGKLEIPLSGQPIFVLSEVPTDVLGFALRNAAVSGIRPLAAQFLPLSRVPGQGIGSAAIRVRVQNIGLGEQSGIVKLSAPKGWKLATNRYDFRLSEGESKTYEFRATASPVSAKWPAGRVPLEVTLSGKSKLILTENVPIASAQNVVRGDVLRLDGELSDWNGAVWQNAGPNAAGVSAKVALKWDANHLFIAAQVKETNVAARRPEETAYEFWKGHDALQIAFGTSDGPETVPAREPFRDSDRGFLLSPFNQTGATQYDGRVLKLWGPDKPYNSGGDRMRWGGAVSGAACVISRDEASGITTYEARLPWGALSEISPLELAAKDGVVRFGWTLHNDEGRALDWSRSIGTFPWWSNTSTFLPEGKLTGPLRSTLGFTQNGEVDLGLAPAAPRLLSPPAPSTAPDPAVPGATTPDSIAPFEVPGAAAPSPATPLPVAPLSDAPSPGGPLPNLPPPSGPLRPRNEPPREIPPFVIPSPPTSPGAIPPPEDEPQPLPPAAPR